MILLLLVSIQIKPIIMELYETTHDKLDSRSLEKSNSLLSQKDDVILCNHCKRTVSNGIRCMGICVADNDY